MTHPRRDVTDFDEMSQIVRQMNEQQLRHLNHLIVERLKLIAQARSTAMLAQFGPASSPTPASNGTSARHC